MDRKNNGSIAFIARQLPSFRKELRQLRASQEEIKRQNALILELIRHTATSANVRKAVRDILSGDASRARPQRNAAKRRQVAPPQSLNPSFSFH